MAVFVHEVTGDLIHVKLGDFGFAKVFEESASTSANPGTNGYMAPVGMPYWYL